MKNNLLLIPLLFILACSGSPDKVNTEKWKAEIAAAEQAFCDLAKAEGIAKAFATYAAPNGVIKRNGKLIIGNEAIASWYKENSKPNTTLSWKPDFIDVSSSGDLAYTYGGFIYTTVDSTGATNESTGSFHTVWKRQADSNWKFVWD